MIFAVLDFGYAHKNLSSRIRVMFEFSQELVPAWLTFEERSLSEFNPPHGSATKPWAPKVEARAGMPTLRICNIKQK